MDPADYMLAICGNDALRELSSPGKSGSIFYLTQDDRFMIKTVKKSEVKVRYMCSKLVESCLVKFHISMLRVWHSPWPPNEYVSLFFFFNSGAMGSNVFGETVNLGECGCDSESIS